MMYESDRVRYRDRNAVSFSASRLWSEHRILPMLTRLSFSMLPYFNTDDKKCLKYEPEGTRTRVYTPHSSRSSRHPTSNQWLILATKLTEAANAA